MKGGFRYGVPGEVLRNCGGVAYVGFRSAGRWGQDASSYYGWIRRGEYSVEQHRATGVLGDDMRRIPFFSDLHSVLMLARMERLAGFKVRGQYALITTAYDGR